MENNKNFLIGILIVLLLCMVGVCLYFIFNQSNEIKSGSVTEGEKQEISDSERIITDPLLINDILEKFEKITGIIDMSDVSGNFSSLNEKFNVDNKIIYVLGWMQLRDGKLNIIEDLLNNKLDNTSKLKIALSITNHRSVIYWNYEDMHFDKSKINQYGLDSRKYTEKFRVISIDELEKNYFELFGEKIAKYEDYVEGLYNSFYYDEVNKVYYRYWNESGGTGPLYYYFYIDQITEKNDNVFIDFYFLHEKHNNLNEKVNVSLCDFTSSKWQDANYNINEKCVFYKEWYTADITPSMENIDMTQFKKHRFVFKKNSEGLYSFAYSE